jgi:hypothetical protein
MQTVVLNTHSALDLKLITAFAREMNIEMLTLTKGEQESVEDLKLLSFMQKARKEGLTDTKETLSKLGIGLFIEHDTVILPILPTEKIFTINFPDKNNYL